MAIFRQLTLRDVKICSDHEVVDHGARVNPSAVYPYIICDEYLLHQADAVHLVKSLGHNTYVTLIEDVDGVAKSLTLEELNAINLSPSQAHAKAVENLENLFTSGLIQAQMFPEGPDGKPFVLIGGHWNAAACILLPKLPNLAKGNLHAEEICLSIPHREALLIFARGDQTYRDHMRAMIDEMEGNQPKPLTFGLFTFGTDAPIPLQE